MFKRLARTAILALLAIGTMWGEELVPPYSWRVSSPLGFKTYAPIDTLFLNYSRRSVPSTALGDAVATTGNLGTDCLNMVYFERPRPTTFYFKDALRYWMPQQSTFQWYNTRIPMTLLSYNTGGTRETEQNRLQAVFSGNATKHLQVGAMLDYLYSRGSYNYQAAKDLIWGVSASYNTDRWQINAFYNHWNMLNKDNGGITDALYITDPAQLQGGDDKVEPKSIPTNLTSAHTRLVGQQLFSSARYTLGSYRELERADTDTVVQKIFIPAMSVGWTINYEYNRHKFITTEAKDAEFWENAYFDKSATNDVTRFWTVQNTASVQMHQGFKPYIPVGLVAWLRHEVRRAMQMSIPDTVFSTIPPEGLTPLPDKIPNHAQTQNRLWLGGMVTRDHLGPFAADASIEAGIFGSAIGNYSITGNLSANVELGRSGASSLHLYTKFINEPTPYFYSRYISNHFIWDNSFDKVKTFNLGGEIKVAGSGTSIRVDYTALKNAVYFGENQMPTQSADAVHVLGARLSQDLHVGILHWDNRLTLQTTSKDEVIPLPTFTLYSNLYLKFKVAKVLDVQFGIDCDYYTKYFSPSYQPATMAFYNQRHTQVGNYPFMNAYANFKLKRARFYLLLSHFNKGWLGGNNYFSMPLYPLNPMRFQMGVSVNFAN